jgi:hypothetical protein
MFTQPLRSLPLNRETQPVSGGLGRAARGADLDWLISHIHALAGLSVEERWNVVAQTRVYDVPAGTVIMRQGEIDDAIFFILEGRVVAGAEIHGAYRALNRLEPGDFFGEIAALTGTPRSATVMAQEPTMVLGVPAATLRRMMRNPLVNGVFLERMAERMARSGAALAPFVSGEQQGPRGHSAASPYSTMLLRSQANPHATALVHSSPEVYATVIMQGQVV